MIPVKICGITRTQDARSAIDAGASAIGFIFYEPSPRYIEPEKAKIISDSIGGEVPVVGVFVDEETEKVNRIARQVGLDFVQLHGNESPDYCARINRLVIKSFRIENIFDGASLGGYDVHAFLFDAYVKGAHGGTGITFNWELVKSLKTETPVILAGGIHVGNIREACQAVGPDAFDVSSGVEISPGIKHVDKIEELFSKVKSIESKQNIFNTQTQSVEQ